MYATSNTPRRRLPDECEPRCERLYREADELVSVVTQMRAAQMDRSASVMQTTAVHLQDIAASIIETSLYLERNLARFRRRRPEAGIR